MKTGRRGTRPRQRMARVATPLLAIGLAWMFSLAPALAATGPGASGNSPEGTTRRPAIARRASSAPRASTPAPPATISSPTTITGITTSPAALALTPAFNQSTHDYVLRCAAGPNSVTFTVQSAGASDQVVTLSIAENQAVTVSDPGTAYWVRCLPHDFPGLTVSKPGSPTPGWYLTSDIPTGANPTDGTFAMILDGNGTPVWYTQTATAVHNVRLLPGGHTLAWGSLTGGSFGSDPYGADQRYDLDTQLMTLKSPAIPPMDAHESLPLANGDTMMLASPLRTGIPDLPSPSMDSAGGNMIDCIVEEVNPDGQLVWEWDAYDHVAPSEDILATSPSTYNGQPAADVYHCNSIDVDPTASNPTSGDLLVSMRSADAVLRIDRHDPNLPQNGHVTWKLGGNGANKDGAPTLAITSDDEGTISGQHDARFQAGPDISIYDDHTNLVGAARGVVYTIDPVAGTAVLASQVKAADGKPANATGSFRRYADGDQVVGWGFKNTGPSMTEVNAAGTDLMDITLQPFTFAYRFVKVPSSALDINTLRRDAGSQPFTSRSGVVLDAAGGLHPYGPDQVNTAGAAAWPGWDIARGVATRADGSGGYTLDGWGGISNFGSAPDVSGSPFAYWPGFDIARGIALCGNGSQGFVADGWGGVHGFGGVADPAEGAYWPGWDIVRGIVATPDCLGGYVLDGWGGIHNFGNASPVTGPIAYWPGWDIARSIVLRPDGNTGYVLDGYGGLHGFGGVASPPGSAYFNGFDIARSITLAGDAQSGYVADGWGAIHNFGFAPPATGSAYYPGTDVVRGAGGS